MSERLQKLMSAAGLCSRREAERWIETGRVKVNGKVATLGESADPVRDRVEVDGRRLQIKKKNSYRALNKPVGYVATMQDPEGRKTAPSLVNGPGERLVPVGRLDLNSEGLLLLSDDGEFVNRMTHPRYKVEKSYLVRVRGLITADAIRNLEQGVELDDGKTMPARVENVRQSGQNSWFEIVITEGRNRQVRRMCDAVGAPVVRLKRIRIGEVSLGELRSGEWRELTSAEVSSLMGKPVRNGRKGQKGLP